MSVVASVVLGAVFAVAGAMKIGTPRQWRAQSAGLGVHPLVATVVPFAEVAVGALLIAQIGRRAVATIALAMLLAFTALLVVRLMQGHRPPCACFGALATRPIGWGNVARNAVFVALASVIILFT